MGLPFHLFFFVRLLFIFFLRHLIRSHSSHFVQSQCRDNERSALWQFKENFIINETVSSDPLAYSKVASWTFGGETSDCCSWDGVECDDSSGLVVGLDLSSSGLYGSIDSNSSLFRLVHLQRLNLAYNHFNYSPIPSQVRVLSRLTYLNLTASMFSGQVPLEISQLSQLSAFHLSYNIDLELKNPNLESFLGNLTHLHELGMNWVSMSSEIPSILANFSSLVYLSLSYCGLHGKIPVGIFKLPNLRVLNVSNNVGLSGEIPASIESLSYLTSFNAYNCSLLGSIPSSLGNLTNLIHLRLSQNNLDGEIPSSLGNLTRLTYLCLLLNKFHGHIPNSLFNLKNLRHLNLGGNNFSSTVEFDKFFNLKHLTLLYLSYSQLSILFNEISVNATFPKFQKLGLSSCNLSKFPDFLRNQDELEYLSLSDNNLTGQVPEWMLSVGRDSLQLLDLANNFLTGFAQQPIFLPWTQLAVLDLGSNSLHGSFPIPAVSTLQFYISDNLLAGNVPELICNLRFLIVLDLSYNNLSGSLPECFNNLSNSLSILDLRRNKFTGSIPQFWTNGSLLKIVNFSQNRFQGQLPRSLAKCTMLKVIDICNNQFNDSFPTWLENLPNLEVLILRSNEFSGPIRTSKCEYIFPNLHIIDISYNHFTGKLPFELFGNRKPTSFGTANSLEYIHVDSTSMPFLNSSYYQFPYGYNYSMTMTNKGQNMFFAEVQELFIAIDMSSNRFSGEILEGIKNLRGSHLLNLSNNMLSSQIPPSLGDLVELEALDLSQNELFGEIPYELTQLTYLESFNVSYNNLKGPIPQGYQFGTFGVSSFEGNQELCGTPLSKKCENFDALPSPSSIVRKHEDPQCPFDFSWKIVVIGYTVGFVFGVMIGHMVIAKKCAWLMKTFGIKRLI